jgi:hypothetical protein
MRLWSVRLRLVDVLRAALVETAGYVPVALSPDDYVELLHAEWRAVNAYGSS